MLTNLIIVRNLKMQASARRLLCSTQMRIFVGLDLPEEIRSRIAQFMAEVRGLAPDFIALASIETRAIVVTAAAADGDDTADFVSR